MRKRRFATLALGLALLAGLPVAARWLARPDWGGHPLVGLWVAGPLPGGIVSPHALSLSPDGTGRESSGVGNFDCRWRPLAPAGGVLRIRVTHGGGSYWAGEAKVLDVELAGPDAIKIRGRPYARQH